MKLELPEYRYCPQCGAQVELQNKEGRNRPVCSACGHIIYEDKVLLTLRDVEPKMGEWCLPGGFLEWGESPEEGAKRELFEETGLNAEELSLVGVYDSVTGARLHVLLVAYRVTLWTGTPVAGDDASEVRWFDIDSVPALAFAVHEKALLDTLERIKDEK